MAESEVVETQETDIDRDATRIYEVGYHIIPTVAEENIESIVSEIRSVIEKAGGSFIAEGAPSLIKLAYSMGAKESGRNVEHDRGYFGWIKFEASTASPQVLEEGLKSNPNILRFIVFAPFAKRRALA
jgi:ribosomal protein S6